MYLEVWLFNVTAAITLKVTHYISCIMLISIDLNYVSSISFIWADQRIQQYFIRIAMFQSVKLVGRVLWEMANIKAVTEQ